MWKKSCQLVHLTQLISVAPDYYYYYPNHPTTVFCNKMRYILWVVALLKACDVTNNCRRLGRHLGFCQGLEIRLKPREMVIFYA